MQAYYLFNNDLLRYYVLLYYKIAFRIWRSLIKQFHNCITNLRLNKLHTYNKFKYKFFIPSLYQVPLMHQIDPSVMQ